MGVWIEKPKGQTRLKQQYRQTVCYMNIFKITISLAIFSLYSCTSYKETIMQPWVGAPKKELIVKWGYPQSANDLVKIDDSITVYSYRSYREGPTGRFPCVVSFTIKNETVISYKYEGSNCPRIQR